ncbi:hypothetical protein HGM15179_017136 [Zosterops borbonicus]|uniref:Uncharacterized protein n=1 Tax=Zosterops borbonicus TaxID=364589 RepID=A0A8K1LDJ6_9PASS|nr:hypothetical protein HGM15179_017136 [Zosterops borbonicus]
MNNYTDTKVSEEGGRGGAPSVRAEIPLQVLVMTMVKQVVPLQPTEIPGDAEIYLQPMEESHAGVGGCLEKAVSPWETRGEWGPAPRLEQPVLEGLDPVEE